MSNTIKCLLKDSLKNDPEAVELMTKTVELIDALCYSNLSEEDDQYMREMIAHMVITNR